MSDESFIVDPDAFGMGDIVVTAFSQWSGEWWCMPWTDKPARVSVGYRLRHRRRNQPDHYVYVMPVDTGGFAFLAGIYGDPMRDEILLRWEGPGG